VNFISDIFVNLNLEHKYPKRVLLRRILTLRKLNECIKDSSWNAKGVSEMAFLPQGSLRGEVWRIHATPSNSSFIALPGKRPEIWLDESGSKLVFIRVSREIFNESHVGIMKVNVRFIVPLAARSSNSRSIFRSFYTNYHCISCATYFCLETWFDKHSNMI